jgi:hypothetical protein
MSTGAQRASRCVVLTSAFPDGFTGTGYAAASILPVLGWRFDRVDYVAVNAPSVPAPPSAPGSPVFHRIDADTAPKWRRFAKSLLSPLPASALRYRRPGLVDLLGRLADEAGGKAALVVLDAPLYWPLLAEPSLRRRFARVALWCQNVNAEMFSGLLGGMNPILRAFWRLEIARLERYEGAALRDADAVWAITPDDERGFRERFGVACDAVVGIRVGVERFARPLQGDPFTLLYLGSFDIRKRQGIVKFVRGVFPELRRRFPSVRLVLGGKGSEAFDAPAEGISGLGFVEDEAAFLRQGLVVVNPQEAGSGIKLKSLHALADGKALLTTPVGAQGIPGRAGLDYLLAPRVEEMGDVLAPYLEAPELLIEVAGDGRAAAASACSETAYDEHFRRVLEWALAGKDVKDGTGQGRAAPC